MKKIITGIIVAVLAISMLFTFTACNKYKWEAVGGMEDAQKAAENNGSFAVKQGNYLYFVNGVDSTALASAKDNKWGNASVKGSIMKSKINEDGSLECLGVVVPKLFHSGYSGAGLYIYGQWIYYVSKTIKTDNAGNVVSGLEYMRTTIDGTKTQSILDIENASSNFIFTPKGLLYTHESNIHFVSYNDEKVGDDKVVVEEYTDIEVSKANNAMFYVKASTNTLVAGQTVGVVDENGQNKEIIKPDTYYEGEGVYYEEVSSQFEFNLISTSEKTIYYTKTCVDAEGKVGTYAYKFADTYDFDKTKEVKFANTALSTIYPLGIEKGVLDVSSANVKLYKVMTGEEENASEEAKFSAQITISFIDGEYVYYVQNSNLYRADLIKEDQLNTAAYEEKVSESSIGSTYGGPKLINGAVYYEDTKESNYLHAFALKDYVVQDGKVTMPKSYIVSGYVKYTYADDQKDIILNKDDEKIKDMAPKYMTEADVKTYIENHKSNKEE